MGESVRIYSERFDVLMNLTNLSSLFFTTDRYWLSFERRRYDLDDRGWSAKYLGVGKKTLYRYVNERVIPFYWPDGVKKIRFRSEELDAWFESGRVDGDSARSSE